MKRWHFHWPGMVYAGNVYGDSEAQARATVRKLYGLTRLPNGAAFW